MEICNLCQRKQYKFTDIGSENKAEIYLAGRRLYFCGDKGATYEIRCSYCPDCGRLLAAAKPI